MLTRDTGQKFVDASVGLKTCVVNTVKSQNTTQINSILKKEVR